MEIISFT